MKRITKFLMFLLLAMCGIGASAETATLTYDNVQIYKSGSLVTPSSNTSYNHQVRSTTTPLITITIGSGDVVYNTSKFCFGNNNKTYTVAVADGYHLTGFTINYTTGSGVKFTSNGVTSDDDGALTVTGLYAQSTTFYATWGSNGSSSSWQNYSVESIVVDYEEGEGIDAISSNGIQYGTDEAFNLQTEYGLVKDASNIVSNWKESTEGTYAALLDGTYTTFFHSCWSGTSTEDHNLTFTLDNNQTVDEFYFYIKKRSGNSNNRPTAITVEGSNDGSAWTAIGNVTISGASAAQSESVKDYFSAKLGTAGTSYSQIRFTVTATNTGASNNGHVFFTASEWYILPSNTCTDEFFAAAKTLRETDATSANATTIQAAVAAQENAINNMSTIYNYTYILANAAAGTVIEQGNASAQGVSNGYTYTAPTLAGYKFLAAYDPAVSVTVPLDLSGMITASTIYALYTPVLQDLASAVDTCVYTMTTPRGYLKAGSADATVVTTAKGTADMDEPLNQWTFVTLNGNKYLYNVGIQKFVSFSANKGRDFVTSLPATVEGVASTYQASTNPLVFRLTNNAGTTYTLNMDGSNPPVVMIDTWNTHDPGNVFEVAQVPGVTVAPNAYSATFTYGNSDLTSVYVDGTEVATGTAVVLTNAATVSNNSAVNSIETYNGYATLAEALAASDYNGSVVLRLIEQTSNITVNFSNGSVVTKTVTVNDVPEGTALAVADLVGSSSYVTAFEPATITGTDVDQAVTVTYTSTLPFALSADPTDATTSTAYLMTLREKYTDGNATISSNVANVDLTDNGYYWTFGGNEWDGVTVYNRGEAGYMSVENADNSVATFGATPVAFTVADNGEGFSLRPVGTTAYLNERSSLISTWNSSWGATDAGSCLKVYSADEVVGALVSALDPYFTYAGAVNALTTSAAATLEPTYTALLAAPDYTQYLDLKAQVEAALVPVTEGYYVVLSGMEEFMAVQGLEKAMYYDTDNNDIRWTTVDGSAAQVFKLVADGSSYTLYAPLADVYLATKKGVTGTQADALAFDVTASKAAAVALVYNANGGTDAAIHANGHLSGAGVSGTLTNWTADAGASLWRLVPIAIDEITLLNTEGVADGDEVMQGFANATDAQLPLNVTVYAITDETGVGAHLDAVEGSQIAAGEGYIISGVKGATVPLLPVTAAVTAPAGNLLVAGTGEKVYGGYILAYKKGDSEAKFWAISSTGLAVPANRSYLPAGTPTRGLEALLGNGYIDDVTGINGVNAGATTEGAIYDLQGRRVNNATKGVYIINGKKVIK